MNAPNIIYSIEDHGLICKYQRISENTRQGREAFYWYCYRGAIAKLINLRTMRGVDDGINYYIDKKDAIQKAIFDLENTISFDMDTLRELKKEFEAIDNEQKA